jgi:hypothetical protein
MLENGLNAPEAATGDHGGLLRLGRGQRGVYGRARDRGIGALAGIACDYARESDHQEHSEYTRGKIAHSHNKLLQTPGSAHSSCLFNRVGSGGKVTDLSLKVDAIDRGAARHG